MLVWLAAEIQIYIPRGSKGEPGGALHMKVGCRRLVQFGLLVVNFLECHRSSTWFEEDVSASELGFAVENMLKVQPSVGWNKNIACTRAVSQIPDSIVAGPMIILFGVVADYGSYISILERCIFHAATLSVLWFQTRQTLWRKCSNESVVCI